MGRLYEQAAAIVLSTNRCKRKALTVLTTMSRFVKFHRAHLDPQSVTFLMTRIEETQAAIETSLSLLPSLEDVTNACAKHIKYGYLSSFSVSTLQAAADDLAHQFMVLPMTLDNLSIDFEISDTKPIKSVGSIPSGATIINRLHRVGSQSGHVSSALYHVARELAELRVATHGDSSGVDTTYRQRRRRLAETRRHVNKVLYN